jgi:hypothetical protein
MRAPTTACSNRTGQRRERVTNGRGDRAGVPTTCGVTARARQLRRPEVGGIVRAVAVSGLFGVGVSRA